LQKLITIADVAVLKGHICQLFEDGVNAITLNIQVNTVAVRVAMVDSVKAELL
jgi:hypothetical protein